jgi:hypothetical protein
MVRTVEERRAYQKEYWANNKAKLAAKNKVYRANNKEKIADMKKEYQAKNKESIVAQKKEYNAKNKDSIAAQKKEYNAKNKDSIAAYKKEYSQTPNGKKLIKIMGWKTHGVIGNLSKIYDEIYLPSTHCDICKTEYKSTYDRCLDHCHLSGEFRQMLCRDCNTMDRWKKKVNQPEEED